jgi:hypothetical protein
MVRVLEKIFSSRTTMLGLGSVTTGFLFMVVALTQTDVNIGTAVIIGLSWMSYLVFQFLTSYYTPDGEKKSKDLEKVKFDEVQSIAEYPPEEEVVSAKPLTWKERHGVPYVFVPGAGAAEISRAAVKDFNETLAYNQKVDRTLAKAGIPVDDAYAQAVGSYYATK